jgi:hypothetical protein
MEKLTEWLDDSCKRMLTAVLERDAVKLCDVLAEQKQRTALLEACLNGDAQDALLASIAQAQFLATLQRAHVLEAVKNCQHQLAVLQAYRSVNNSGSAGEVCT